MKKKDREKKLKELYEKIKKQIKEKYRFCNLYVKNLPNDISDQQLNKLFEYYGKIRSCKLMSKEFFQQSFGMKTSITKSFGFVCYYEKEHAHEAKVNLNDKEVFETSMKLFIDYHQSKEERAEYLQLKTLSFNHGKNKYQHHNQNNNPARNPFRQNNVFGSNFVQKPRHLLYQKPGNGMMSQMTQMQHMPQMPQMPETKMPFEQSYKMFLGEKLFSKLAANQNYSKFSQYFSKIVGIFLELEEPILMKLINNNEFFFFHVNEVIKVKFYI